MFARTPDFEGNLLASAGPERRTGEQSAAKTQPPVFEGVVAYLLASSVTSEGDGTRTRNHRIDSRALQSPPLLPICFWNDVLHRRRISPPRVYPFHHFIRIPSVFYGVSGK